MADDIVARLRQMAKANGCEAGRGCSEAADVIERLWAVGDALAAIVGDVVVPYDDESKARTMVTAYDTWREARRG